MSYVTRALLNRARSNRVTALAVRLQPVPARPHRANHLVTNVFADID